MSVSCRIFCIVDRVSQLDITITANMDKPVTSLDVIACLCRVVEKFKTKEKTYRASFARVGVVDGAPNCRHFTPKTYAIGAPYRDESLPQVTPQLLAQVGRRCERLVRYALIVARSCSRRAMCVQDRSRRWWSSLRVRDAPPKSRWPTSACAHSARCRRVTTSSRMCFAVLEQTI